MILRNSTREYIKKTHELKDRLSNSIGLIIVRKNGYISALYSYANIANQSKQ